MKMIFMGRKSYGAEMLEWTIDQGIEVIGVCTDTYTTDNPIVEKAEKLGIPLIFMEEAEALSASIDLAVSYLYSNKIRKPMIENPSFGCINFHPALLPDWRGTAGYNVAILNKLPEWGATAHYVDEHIDTGAIIRIFRFSFDYRHETAASLERKTQKMQMELYKSVITDIINNGRLESQVQDINQGMYISREEMRKMKQLDLEKDDISLKVHAFWFPPYHGAYIEVDGKKYTLVDDKILDSLAKYGIGGGIT